MVLIGHSLSWCGRGYCLLDNNITLQEGNQMIHVDVTIENTKSNLTLIDQSVAIYNKFLRGLDKPDLLLVLHVFFLPSFYLFATVL